LAKFIPKIALQDYFQLNFASKHQKMPIAFAASQTVLHKMLCRRQPAKFFKTQGVWVSILSKNCSADQRKLDNVSEAPHLNE